MRQETRPRKKYAAGGTSRARMQQQAESADNGASPEMTPAEWTADQERRKALLAVLIAEAQGRVPGPADSAARQAYRDSPIDEIIVEKFRRQGFNL